MGWRQQNNDDPETIFGMKKEDFDAKLSAGEKAVTELESVKSELQATKDALSGIQTTLGTIAESLPKKIETKTNNEPEIDPNDPEQVARARENFVMSSAAEAKAETVFNQVSRKLRVKDGIVFDQLQDETRELLEKSPLNQRVIPEVVENAYLIVKGRHADEIANDRANKKGKFYIESAQNQSHGGTPIPKTPEEQLTADELNYAKKTGVTAEQYLKQKQNMNVIREQAVS